jgi:holliday junction DNA helicase RuvA
MIAQLTGKVLSLGVSWLVVDLSGMGLRVLCTPNSVSAVRVGEQVSLHTCLVVREDSLTLYGFETAAERDCFELVQTASGIGPRIAQAIVAVFGVEEFASAVLSGNTAAITRVPGIGPKGAAKLVLELKDKVGALAGSAQSLMTTPTAATLWRDQVAGGLESLGYSAKDAEAACDRVSDLVEADPAISVAVLLRTALRSLAK